MLHAGAAPSVRIAIFEAPHPLEQGAQSRGPEEWWADMTEVFHCD